MYYAYLSQGWFKLGSLHYVFIARPILVRHIINAHSVTYETTDSKS